MKKNDKASLYTLSNPHKPMIEPPSFMDMDDEPRQNERDGQAGRSRNGKSDRRPSKGRRT